MWACASVAVDGSCAEWAELIGLLPPLSVADAQAIGAGMFGVWAIAWAARLIVTLLLNR